MSRTELEQKVAALLSAYAKPNRFGRHYVKDFKNSEIEELYNFLIDREKLARISHSPRPERPVEGSYAKKGASNMAEAYKKPMIEYIAERWGYRFQSQAYVSAQLLEAVANFKEAQSNFDAAILF